MNQNKYYLELENKINEIRNNQFEIKTLRKAIIIKKNLIHYYTKHELSLNEFIILDTNLKNIIELYLSRLNSNLTSKTFHTIYYEVLSKEYNSVPTDISIINDNIVLLEEEAYDNPYTNKILILNDNYKELAGQPYHYADRKKMNKENIKEYILFYYGTESKNRKSFNTIINNINELLKPISNKEKTIEFIQNNNILDTIKNKTNIKVFMDTDIEELIECIFKRRNITFNLVAIDNWNEFYLFEIKQEVSQDKSFTWNIEQKNINIWNLSESLEKQNVLTRKKSKN